VTTSGRADVKGLSLLENRADIHLLLKEILGEINLLVNRTTIQLNLKEIGNFLAKLDLADLGMGENTNNLAILLDAGELSLDILRLLRILLGILGEGLSLGAVPILVKSAFDFVRKMLSPNSGQRAKTIGSLHISNNTDNGHGWGLKDSHSFDSILLVQLGTRALNLTNNVSHTSLVCHKSSQVHWGRWIGVLGERPNATSVVLGALLWEVLKGTVTGLLELTMGHTD
jgi:hypothetical protein